MTTKEYLQQIYHSRQRIQRLERQRQQLRANLFSLGSPSDLTKDRVQTTPDDKLIKLVARVDRLERDIVAEIAELTELIATISKQIESVSDERYRTVLFNRYIMCWSWERVAVDMNMTRRWVLKLHGQALNSFRERGH